MNLFPNPTSGAVQLDYFSAASDIVCVTMYDLTGSVVLKQNFVTASGENKFTLDLGTYATGMYLVQVSGSEGVVSEHLVIE